MRTPSIKYRILWFITLLMLAYFATIIMSTQAHAATRWRSGKASYHPYSNRGYVCAARGYPRGSILRAMNPETGKAIDVQVVDASGMPMKGMGRHIDFNKPAFKALYGSLKRGVGPVRWRLKVRGHGAMTGKAW